MAKIIGGSRNDFNIFDMLGQNTRELTHSAFIAQLLNPRGGHGMNTCFLELFIETLNSRSRGAVCLNFDLEGTEVEIEKDFGVKQGKGLEAVGGRIDIYLKNKKGEVIVVYREQAEKLITQISGITEEKAHLLVRNLRKCDVEAHSFGNEFVKLGVSNGYVETEVCEIWKFISLRSQFLLDYDFSLALGWLLYQIEYLKTYYSYVMNGEIESFEKSYNITPIIDTIKQKHNITSFCFLKKTTMVELLLKRYLWLINTLKSNGEMTFDEIAEHWEHSSFNDNGSVLTKRTFYNHCQAVARHFGIDIECRRGRGMNLYSIANPETIEKNTLTKWALDSFSFGELLLGNASIADKILLEYIPSGREWLEPVLQSLQQNTMIDINYENFVGVKFSGCVCPLCVKLFKRRWYVLCLTENNRKRIFSLDRIKTLLLTDKSFDYPKDFVPADYFHDVFGIVAGVERKVENIVIRTYAELPGYLRSLPMHHSLRELSTSPEHTDFSLRLVPTFDFIQELLLHRDQLEVLSPQSLRDEINDIITTMKNRYDE